MNEKTFTYLLDRIAARGTSRIDLNSAIQARLQPKYATQIAYRLPLARLGAAFTLCIMLVTAVYALVQSQRIDAGLRAVDVTELNMTQTIGDTTVTLEWAYADGNRISVAYAVTTPDGWGNFTERLTQSIAELSGENLIHYAYTSMMSLDDTDPTTLLTVANFDAIDVEGQPESLLLTLRVGEDFVFPFTVPFIPGIRIEAQPSVEYPETTVKIGWALITPSMTRVNLCYTMPEGGRLWYPNLHVEFDGERIVPVADGMSPFQHLTIQRDGSWCRSYVFLTSYDELPDEIAVIISSFQTETIYSKENMQRAAAVFAEYGIMAKVVRNNADRINESYQLEFPSTPDDLDFFEQVNEEALAAAGKPLRGERITGRWTVTARLP